MLGNECFDCDPNCFECAGSVKNCTKCSSELKLDKRNNTCVNECEANKTVLVPMATGQSDECVPCNSNCLTCSNSIDLCTTCP